MIGEDLPVKGYFGPFGCLPLDALVFEAHRHTLQLRQVRLVVHGNVHCVSVGLAAAGFL